MIILGFELKKKVLMLGRLKGKSKRITTATARTCCRIVGAMLKLTQYCPDETAVVHFSDFSFT